MMNRVLSLLLVTVCSVHGAVFDLQGFIDTRLAEGEKHIVIPPGRYEVVPRNGHHLLLEDLSDITISAEGVEMICTETTRAISIKRCRNLTIFGLSIDYDPLPFTQGRIVEISADRKSHTIEIMNGFPPAESAYVFKHTIYTPQGELRFGNYFRYTLEPLPGNRLKIAGLHPRKDGGEEIGDVVVVSTMHIKERDLPHAVVCEFSDTTIFDEVSIYASNCFGFLETDCSGSLYLNCTIDRLEGRMHSLNADAFHSKFATVGPRIIACKAMWQGDDCVNICGSYHLVSETVGDSARILVKENLDIQVGDTVELIDSDGNRLPDAKVLSLRPAGEISAYEVAHLKELEIGARTHSLVKGAYLIQFDRELEIDFGGLVCSQNRKGNGFAVKDCIFGNNRSRGILVKASDGEISGNHIENCYSEAIKIAPERYWLESGYSRNLKIHGNTVVNSGMEALQVEGIGQGEGFENIRISDNRFVSSHTPVVTLPASGCEVLEGNTVNGADLQQTTGE